VRGGRAGGEGPFSSSSCWWCPCSGKGLGQQGSQFVQGSLHWQPLVAAQSCVVLSSTLYVFTGTAWYFMC